MAPATFLKYKKPLTIVIGVAALGVLYLSGGRQYMQMKEMKKFEAEAREIWLLRQNKEELVETENRRE